METGEQKLWKRMNKSYGNMRTKTLETGEQKLWKRVNKNFGNRCTKTLETGEQKLWKQGEPMADFKSRLASRIC